MTPKQLVERWIAAFNAADIEALVSLYAPDAVNHQVVMDPLIGRDAIKNMFRSEFGRATMVCIPLQIHEAGEWAILEWKDPLGMHGCGFFHVQNDQIIFQRGYFDQLTFFRIQGLPVPKQYLAP